METNAAMAEKHVKVYSHNIKKNSREVMSREGLLPTVTKSSAVILRSTNWFSNDGKSDHTHNSLAA